MNISNKGNLHSNIKNPAPSSAANEPVTVASIDAEFLPLIYDVVRRFVSSHLNVSCLVSNPPLFLPLLISLVSVIAWRP